jgi:hypothetical protein
MNELLLRWCRWLLLVPALFVGESIGPLLQSEVIFYYFPGTTAFPVLNAIFALATSSFGAVLLCATVAPNARVRVGICVAIFLMMEGLLMGFPNPDQDGYQPNRWTIFGSYLLGDVMALLVLSWILTSNSKVNSARQP